MTQRVSSDTTETVRATLAQAGATNRANIEIPADDEDSFPADELVRVVMDDTEYRARIERPLTGDGRLIRGVYDTPRLARNPGEGENRLSEWFADSNRSFGQSVLIDVVEEGFKYGIREPGSRAVYEATEAPTESLADIARQVDDE
ncbi:hypothetical protein ZOD2009_12215 [Haladaptatus paucihalophilus DX253]|uniref:Uncharacterized protein n=1 Tax=Haladaptatus paucihalophilus DX253 TaxID=797209 RepID=E7QUG3_HALPU|nr:MULTISPECIES: hypothetical protein [Haladaptatus]EFW92242.1 hypothetical protein ZOD2009_12215 [Haladaptatus paucihalophilus DX253]GKZ14388.1 hypothetical protein HAL_22690 [Haladaptatus sp. T7]SHK92934.1 hypothetical protein SAMN05444342_2651 [Haladaptatus paucihalophilus DX253]